jgi:hypothetical protein
MKLTGILTCWAGTDQWVWSWTKMAMRSCMWLGCCRHTVCLLHKKHSGFRIWTKESQSDACSTYHVPDVEGHRSTLNYQHPVHQIQSCHQQFVLLLPISSILCIHQCLWKDQQLQDWLSEAIAAVTGWFASSNLSKFHTHHLIKIEDKRNSASPLLPPARRQAR